MTDILTLTQQEIALSTYQRDENKETESNFSTNSKNNKQLNETFDDIQMPLLAFNNFFVGLGTLSNASCVQHRPRYIAYVVIYTALGAGDIYYFSFPPLTVMMILIPLIVLIGAFYVDIISPKLFGKAYYKKKTTETDCWKMTHLDIRVTVEKTYSNAICWFFDAPNDFGIYDDKIFILFFVIYFVMFIGSLVIHLTVPGPLAYFCLGNERGIEPVEEDGRCFFTFEWTLTMNFVTFESLVFCIISSIGIKEECIDAIKNAQQKIQLITSIGDNDNSSEDCEYSKFIEDRRKKSIWASTFTKKCVKYGVFCVGALVFSVHLLWFPNSDTKAFYGPNKEAVYFVYAICVFIIFAAVITAVVTLISLIGPYKDFYVITTALGQLETKPDNMVTKIGNWWLIRQFYHSYVYVIYYQLSNTVFAVIAMCTLSGIAIITWWAIRAHFFDDYEDFLTYSTVCTTQFIIFMCVWVVIASLNIARVHSHRIQHIKMLKYQIILQKYFKALEHNDAIDVMDLLCTYITHCDVAPSVFGVTITWEKIYLFIGYVISAIITIGSIINSD